MIKQIIVLYSLLAVFYIQVRSDQPASVHISARSIGMEVQRYSIASSMCDIYSRAESKLYTSMISQTEYIKNFQKNISDTIDAKIKSSNKREPLVRKCAEAASEQVNKASMQAFKDVQTYAKTNWERFLDDFDATRNEGEKLKNKILASRLDDLNFLQKRINDFQNTKNIVSSDVGIWEILVDSSFHESKYAYERTVNDTKTQFDNCLQQK